MKSVVFDWGGVLMKTVDQTFRWAWDDKLSLPRGTVEEVFFSSDAWNKAQLGAISESEMWHAVAQRLGIDPEDVISFRYDFFAGDALDRDVIEIVRRVRTSGYLTGLLSNNGPHLRGELTALRIAEFFDTVVISCEVKLMKPSRAIFTTFERVSGVESHDIVLVDDAIENIKGARRAGWHAIYYSPDVDLRRDLSLYFDI